MYSIVMLTAMSAGADVTPPPVAVPGVAYAPVGFGGYGGCSGIAMGGCTGYGSCYGSCHGGGGRLFGKHKGGFLGGRGGSCHGCSGYSCSGYSCFGSCYGSCYGSGSSWGPPVMMPPYTLHGYGDPYAVYGRTYYPNQPPVMTVPVAPMAKPSGSDTNPMGANLRIKLPADAKLFVDGKPAPGTGPERAFYTPPLEAGKKFFYDLKAELVVNGKTVTEEKKVIVEAGANITEEFTKLTAALAKPDNVAGK
jgi:uncharacterized protein (TIGR03000 family)